MQCCHRLGDALRIGTRAVRRGAHVMHHHVRATLGQQAAVSQAEATGGTGYQAHLAFERDTGIGFHRHSFNQARRPRPILLAARHDTPTLSRVIG